VQTVLSSLLSCMQAGCRLNPRQTHPTATQFLEGLPQSSHLRTPPTQEPRRSNDRGLWAGMGQERGT